MLLNNLSQQFVVYFGHNWFYPEVRDRWEPVMLKMGLPYITLEDMVNSQIQSITFPALNMEPVTQQRAMYTLQKRDVGQVDMRQDKSLNITFKLTESYLTYFIIRHQMDMYHKIGVNVKGLYWDPITVQLLDDQGYASITYEQHQITPTGMSELSLSYGARLGTYNTFTLNTVYNFFDIWYKNTYTGKMEKLTLDL